MTTLIPVPSAGTPKQTIRVDDALWEAFKEACKAEGVSAAADIRAHMRRKVEQHQQKLAQQKADEATREGTAG